MSQSFVSATSFNFLLPWYDQLVARCTKEDQVKAHLLSQIAAGQPRTVLDVGCGSGTLLTAAQELQSPSTRWCGVDLDPEILKQARRKLSKIPAHSRPCLIRGNCQQLPFHSLSVDCVVCSLVLHHLTSQQKQRCLNEICRVLRPGGKLFLADFCRANHWLASLQFLTVRFVDGWQQTRCNAAGRLPDMMSASGLDDVSQSCVMDTPLGTIRCYSATASGHTSYC